MSASKIGRSDIAVEYIKTITIPPYTQVHVDRFNSRVQRGEPDECWPWVGCPATDGYGIFSIGETLIKAHRFAYLLAAGALPDGLMVRHTCDNPPCCNPRHLTLGDRYDNITDMFERGRYVTQRYPEKRRIGSKHNLAKLTEEQVLAIRAEHQSVRCSYPFLAKKYGVSSKMIGYIIRRQNWTHI